MQQSCHEMVKDQSYLSFALAVLHNLVHVPVCEEIEL